MCARAARWGRLFYLVVWERTQQNWHSCTYSPPILFPLTQGAAIRNHPFPFNTCTHRRHAPRPVRRRQGGPAPAAPKATARSRRRLLLRIACSSRPDLAGEDGGGPASWYELFVMSASVDRCRSRPKAPPTAATPSHFERHEAKTATQPTSHLLASVLPPFLTSTPAPRTASGHAMRAAAEWAAAPPRPWARAPSNCCCCWPDRPHRPRPRR